MALRQLPTEAEWKHSGILGATDREQKLYPPISNLPVVIENRKSNKVRLGLHGYLQFSNADDLYDSF